MKSPHLLKWITQLSSSTNYLFLMVLLSTTVLTEESITHNFQKEGADFQKILLHRKSGSVFLGARNTLYQLSPELEWQQEVGLGPARDSHNCLNPQDECVHEKTLRDERVKLLLNSPNGDELLVCGNLYQGSCAKVAAHNISYLNWVYTPVVGVASDAVFSSTAAVVTENDVLFVANSVNTHISDSDGDPLNPSRTSAPFLATRNFSSLGLRYKTQFAASQMNIFHGVLFRAMHKYAFTYRKSAYFLVTEEKEKNSKEAGTFLGRICQDDLFYRSYVEAQLVCEADGLRFNTVEDAYIATANPRLTSALRMRPNEKLLFVAFSIIRKDRWTRDRHSAMCVYRMSDVHTRLNQIIKNCYNGAGSLGPFHLTRPAPCKFTNIPISDNYCGEQMINFPIRARELLNPILVRPFVNTQLSALTVSTIGDNTLVYLGTRTGSLLKVEIQGPGNMTHYDTTAVHPGNVILPSMQLTEDGTALFAMSSSMVVRVQMLDCSGHSTCETCMASADPHCGWCPGKKRCTPQYWCEFDILGWTRTRTARCPSIISAQPNFTHVATPILVTLQLSTTPKQPDKTTCAVRVPGGSIGAEAILLFDRTLQCKSQMTWPQLPEHKVSEVFPVDINIAGVTWLSTNVTVYDCTRHRNCTDCVTSENPCAWCIATSQCSDAHKVHLLENCGSGNFIYTQHFASSSHAHGRGPNYCPRIEQLGAREPLLHSDVRGDVSVTGVQLPLEISREPIICQFESSEVSAIISPLGNNFNITCPNVVLQYKKDVPFTSLSLKVLWGKKRSPLDNPSNLGLKLYNCEHMATNCGQCLTLDTHFQCGQCEGDCSRQQLCPTTWHNQSFICPNPIITRVQPLFGPTSGGTQLTIHGINLGQKEIHIDNGVTVGGHRCIVMDYTPTTSIVCRTPPRMETQEARIAVTVAGQHTTHSSSLFGYIDPVIDSITPNIGPVSGGTNVTLTGRNLDVGSSMQIKLETMRNKRQAYRVSTGSDKYATIHRRNNESIVFGTQRFDRNTPSSMRVAIIIDGHEYARDNIVFHYAKDPTISELEPNVALHSGGTLVTVHGTSFDIIQKPRLVTYAENQPVITECTLLSNQTGIMTCLTPRLLYRDEDKRVKLNYGFIMDNVTQLLNMSRSGQTGLEPIDLHPDPVLDSIPNDVEYDLDQPLNLPGSHLGVLQHFSEFIITVGGSLCNVTTINDTVIVCQPTAEPEWLKDGKAQVVLEIQNHQTSPGYIKVRDSQPFTMGLPFILAIVAGTLVVITFILLLCLCRRYRKDKKKSLELPVGIEDSVDIPLTRLNTQKDEKNIVAEVVAPEEGPTTEATPLTSAEGEDYKPQEENGNIALPRNSYVSVAGASAAKVRSLLKEVIDAKLLATVQDVLIPQSQLTLGEVIGKGHFGCVYSGMLKTEDGEEPQKVAVKTIQAKRLDVETIESFLKEGVLMKDFDHPHVLQLLGVSVTDKGENPLVVLPYMAEGDLRYYVKNKSRSFTARQLLSLGQQVAEGMAYLAHRGFVHRDLAARNCMVDEDAQVKVADFGLSKDLYEKDYYSSVDRKRKMPIKWMALESLEDCVFTTKSDVWSFGVLLWELMIRGVTPYPDVDAFEMRNYLSSGRRLRQPKFCPDNAYILMAECWGIDPNDRPTFPDLVNRLELMVNPPRRTTSDISDIDEPLYVNIQRQSILNDLESDTTA